MRFGSWPLVFAAYNAGYGAVLRSITNYNTNDYWELVKHESGLPWESSLYVPKIIAAAIVGRNQAAFGFADVTPEPAFAYEEVDRARGDRAGVGGARGGREARGHRGAEPAAGAGPDAARSWRDARARPCGVGGGVRGGAGQVARRLREAGHRGAAAGRDAGRRRAHARRRGARAPAHQRRQGVDRAARGRGDPGAASGPRPTRARTPARTETGRTAADGDETILVAVPERSFSYEGRERVFYRTRDGDGLNEIADAFGVKSDELCEWNNLDPGAKLQPRMVMQIFVRKDFDRAGVMLLDPAQVRAVSLGSEEFLELETARRGKKRLFYTAKTGDTLAKLGRRYGLTPGDLARINRFSYNTELHEGDRIVVYSPTAGRAARDLAGADAGQEAPRADGGRGARTRRAGEAQAGAGRAADAKKKPPAAPRTSPKSDGKGAGADKAGAKKK